MPDHTTIGDMISAGTTTSPEIRFDASTGALTISGESYSEDAATLLETTYRHMRDYMQQKPEAPIQASFALIYFNSSSVRKLMNLLVLFDEAAGAGRQVRIDWKYRSDDFSMEEFGEEFAEDIEHAEFHLVETDD